jgi:hypothetical protein
MAVIALPKSKRNAPPESPAIFVHFPAPCLPLLKNQTVATLWLMENGISNPTQL